MNEQITVNLNNLTEEEREQFKTLVDKGRGKSSRESCVWKPKKGEVYYYINDCNVSIADFWNNVYVDKDRWKIGNIFKTEKEAEFAREKKKVEVELERYAREHNGSIRSDSFYLLYNNKSGEKLDYDVWSTCKPQGGVQFTSKQLVFDAIEAIGKDRILKYIFGVESEGEE